MGFAWEMGCNRQKLPVAEGGMGGGLAGALGLRATGTRCFSYLNE